MHGREGGMAPFSWRNRRADRVGHVEEFQVDEDFLPAVVEPVDERVSMTRHEDFEADLVEAYRVAETLDMPPRFLDIGKVERVDQPFLGRIAFAESMAEEV